MRKIVIDTNIFIDWKRRGNLWLEELATRNVKHFGKVKGLKIFNPAFAG